MIKNEREHRITKSQIRKFEQTVAELDSAGASKMPGIDPAVERAHLDGLRSQLDELRQDVAEYEFLRSGQRKVFEAHGLAELPALLIRARIAAGLTQRELAERLGLKEQQVQRYEATGYGSASLDRLAAVAEALGLSTQGTAFLPTAAISFPNLLKRTRDLGVSKDLIISRLLPSQTRLLLENEMNVGAGAVVRAASYIGRVFGISAEDLLSGSAPQLRLAAATQFKLPAAANDRQLPAYTAYAHYLALLALTVVRDRQQAVPTDYTTLRNEVERLFGSVSFVTVLRYVWSLGIAVLPLDDPGAFNAACWRYQGRSVVALKQGNHSPSRWLFDLLHEMWHCAQHPELDSWEVVEAADDEGQRARDGGGQDEVAANRFAGDVILAGRAEELTQLCVRKAGGEVARLKRAVMTIAEHENVPTDGLANYLAYRLGLQGINWWGAAEGLQDRTVDAWSIARDMFLQSVDLTPLNEVDRDLLLQALADRRESNAG